MEKTPELETINVVVWGDNTDEVNKCLSKLTDGTLVFNKEIAEMEYNSRKIKIHTRYPHNYHKYIPIPVVDVLLMDLNSKESCTKSEAFDYIDQRKGIPFIFLLAAEENLTDKAKQHGCEVINYNDANSDFFSKCLKSAIALDVSLSAIFNQIDRNSTGFISSEDILQLADDLKQVIINEEANQLIESISDENTKVDYFHFRQWWFLGRQRFNQFRRLVEMKMDPDNLFTNDASIFNSYFKKIAKEVLRTQTEAVDYSATIKMLPQVDFENGFEFISSSLVGEAALSTIRMLPSYICKNTIGYSFEFNAFSSDSARRLTKKFEAFYKIMQVLKATDLNRMKSKGLSFHFRHINKTAFVDLVMGEEATKDIIKILNVLQDFTKKFSGIANLSIISNINAKHLLDLSLEQLVTEVLNFKVYLNGEGSGFRECLQFLAEKFRGNFFGLKEDENVGFYALLSLASSLKALNYEFVYNQKDLVENILGLLGFAGLNKERIKGNNPTIGLQLISNSFAEFQGVLKEQLTKNKVLIEGFSEILFEIIEMIDFEKLGFSIIIENFQILYSFRVNLRGVNTFIRENILS